MQRQPDVRGASVVSFAVRRDAAERPRGETGRASKKKDNSNPAERIQTHISFRAEFRGSRDRQRPDAQGTCFQVRPSRAPDLAFEGAHHSDESVFGRCGCFGGFGGRIGNCWLRVFWGTRQPPLRARTIIQLTLEKRSLPLPFLPSIHLSAESSPAPHLPHLSAMLSFTLPLALAAVAVFTSGTAAAPMERRWNDTSVQQYTGNSSNSLPYYTEKRSGIATYCEPARRSPRTSRPAS